MYLEAQIRILTKIVTNLINYFKTTKYSYNQLFTGATFVFDRGKNHIIIPKMMFYNSPGLLVIWFCHKIIHKIIIIDCKLSALTLLLPWFGCTIFYVYCLNWLGELINRYHLRKKSRIMSHSSIELSDKSTDGASWLILSSMIICCKMNLSIGNNVSHFYQTWEYRLDGIFQSRKIILILIRVLRPNKIKGVLQKAHRLVNQEIIVLSNLSQRLWTITNNYYIYNYIYNMYNAPTLSDGGLQTGGFNSKPTSHYE
jgi:hypothetical protein